MYLHHRRPEMHRLWSHFRVPEPAECTLFRRALGMRRRALPSPAGEAQLALEVGLEVGPEGLAEAEAESRGHVDYFSVFGPPRCC